MKCVLLKRVLLTLFFVFGFHSAALATWSVIALDRSTGQVIIASATCVSQRGFPGRPARDLMEIQAVIVPGVGIAACQAGVDNSRANQMLVYEELLKGTDPEEILRMLSEDPRFQSRQFGIIDMQGRSVGFSGDNNRFAALHVSGRVGQDIFYQVQGNILFSERVMYDAALAFTKASGTLADRVMAAMEAADDAGGDSRCTCLSEPLAEAVCDGKTSHVAYIAIANADDARGESHNDGDYYAYISVTNENTPPTENANPVKTLRLRYDAWKNAGAPRLPPAPSLWKPGGAGSVLRVDAAIDALVPGNFFIQKLEGNFGFTEGPVWVRGDQPHLLFSDLRGNAIHRWDRRGGLSTFMQPVFEGDREAFMGLVGSNGLTIDAQGRLVLFEHGNRRVSRMEEDGSLTVLVDNYQGRRLNSPNDGVYRSDGSLYFTDPPYGLARMNDDPAKELDFNGIFRLSPDGELELLNSDQSFPNGVAFSPDERTLYVANSDNAQKVWMAYDVQDDGSLANGRVFFDASTSEHAGVPDGLKVDTAGNLFATGPGGVWVIDPNGTHLGTIRPEELPANVAWGDDGRTLYMTARTSLYRIVLTTEGPIPGR